MTIGLFRDRRDTQPMSVAKCLAGAKSIPIKFHSWKSGLQLSDDRDGQQLAPGSGF
jgi:hypothetical protein